MRVHELHGEELISYDQIVQELVELKTIEARLNWTLGDMLVPIKGYVSMAARSAGHNARRLQICAEVAHKFPLEERERDLPWAFFAAVKNYELTEACALLARAEDENLSLSAFGRLLRNEPEPETHDCPDPACGKPHRIGVPHKHGQ